MMEELRTNIITHLIQKGNYSEDVDVFLVDMLIDNMVYAESVKESLTRDGLVIRNTNGNGFTTTQMNPAFGIYQMCLRNIHQCCAKLGISRKDRIALKLVEEKTKDDFDKEFN